MNVLFISRAKQDKNPSPVIQAQATSLASLINLSVYLIQGKGWRAYIANIFKLRKHLKSNPPGIIHAHYSYVGMVASLASKKPIVVSLMGSDIEDYKIGRILIQIFSKISWNVVIVKSQRSKNNIKLKNALVIPNGVNLDIFKPFPYNETRKKLGFNPNKKYVLFLAHPGRYEKNHALAKSACELVGQHYDLQLLTLDNTPHKEIPYFLSAVDVLLLTSLFEGSPNAIKEAMACNCPIVTTDVGDVKKIIGDTEGCYICSSELEDVAEKLRVALGFGERTSGRENIKNYDDQIIAHELLVVYKNVLKQ